MLKAGVLILAEYHLREAMQNLMDAISSKQSRMSTVTRNSDACIRDEGAKRAGVYFA